MIFLLFASWRFAAMRSSSALALSCFLVRAACLLLSIHCFGGYGFSFQSCCLALFHPIFFGFGEDAAGLAGDAARVRFIFEEAVGWGRVGGDTYKIVIV